MGRKSITGGVTAKGDDRIQLDFWYQGKRYRPTIEKVPNKKNLDDARKTLQAIKRRIRNGTFNFADEFPDYKFIDDVAPPTEVPTLKEVAIAYLKSARRPLAFATWESYRKILGIRLKEIYQDAPDQGKRGRALIGFWCPRLGHKPMDQIRYSDLTNALDDDPNGNNKTRNNRVTPIREVFLYAVKDKIIAESPAEGLAILPVQKPKPDPFRVDEAEAVIAGIREDWGDNDANYFELQFFAGPRPSETIAMNWPDMDFLGGTLHVCKARVMAQDKDTTKNYTERDIELNQRAFNTIKRQYDLTGGGKGPIFVQNDGKGFHDLQTLWKRWKFTLERLGVRYREPYQCRHTSVTWNLMIGENFLKVAEQHGHSPAVMLKTYAKWLKGATPTEIASIKRAMGFATNLALAESQNEVKSLTTEKKVMAEREGFEPSDDASVIPVSRKKRG